MDNAQQQQEGQQQRQGRSRAGSGSGGRGASWLRNNWTESETREVMGILVDEFVTSGYTTQAYSKSHGPDVRFQGLSFVRPRRELYNKVQNLRQRFFTPHSYLLRWATRDDDARVARRAEKSLMNPKTRDSVHGIFAAEVPPALLALAGLGTATASGPVHDPARAKLGMTGGGADSAVAAAAAAAAAAAKSVNYYCDIFRARSPSIWHASVEAYRLFLADAGLQQAAAVAAAAAAVSGELSSGPSDSESRRRKRSSVDVALVGAARSPPQSLASSAQQTPSSAMMTDFGSDDGSAGELQLVAVAGHSWHRFLALRSRWTSLGLHYAGREDWERREMAFVVQHLLTLVDPAAATAVDMGGSLPLTVVAQFAGSFDAANIEMAVARSPARRSVRVAALVDDLLACVRQIDAREQFTVVSLCWMADRATRTQASLALLVSHGSSGQRFGAFPHNDAMFARLVAGSEGLWHEYYDLATADDGIVSQSPRHRNSELPSAAFAYAQSGLRYTFFTRRRGHFFEIARDDDWAPTMVPAHPRPVWRPCALAHDGLLILLRQDTEKLLVGMAELFGLRMFCAGYFEPTASSSGGPRRVSDDPAAPGHHQHHNQHRRSHSSMRIARQRASAGALAVSGNVSSASNGSPYLSTPGSSLPYRRPPRTAGVSIDYHQLSTAGGTSAGCAVAAAAAGLVPQAGRLGATGLLGHSSHVGLTPATPAGMLPFLSPQLAQYLPLPSADMAAMSVSLPNSPLFGFPPDNNAAYHHYHPQPQQQQAHNGTPHDAAHFFPSLSDASLAAAVAATTAAGGGLLPDPSLGGLASIAATPAGRTPVLADDPLGVSAYQGGTALTSALASLGGVHAPAATPPLPRPDASTLFAGMAASLSPTHSIATGPLGSGGSPAFWDAPSTGLQQMQIAGAPAASPAMGGAFGMPALGFDAHSATTANVAIYPQPAATGASPWDGAMAQSLSSVLGNTDMLMSIVRPAHTPSALATPALDCLAGSADVSAGACTPGMLSAGPALLELSDADQSSLAAYFGATTGGGSCGESSRTAAMDHPKLIVVSAPDDLPVSSGLATMLYPPPSSC
ncbi:hypothetical protein H4R19_000347 [Coemansia spiralis]|nr:hypothetical protein H4R19_000347 [Coemansia spiralis]